VTKIQNKKNTDKIKIDEHFDILVLYPKLDGTKKLIIMIYNEMFISICKNVYLFKKKFEYAAIEIFKADYVCND